MYNGIGLTTPRGSGTSGYVQRNLSALRVHDRTNDKIWDAAPPKYREPDEAILEHERKRKVEVKCLELQVELEDKEVDDVEIERRVDELRQKLLANLAVEPKTGRGSFKPSDTHAMAAAKKTELAKMARALGTRADYQEGDAFDREKQEEARQRRILEREDRENERIERTRKRESERKKMEEQKKKWQEERQKRIEDERERRKEREREPSRAERENRAMPPPPDIPRRDHGPRDDRRERPAVREMLPPIVPMVPMRKRAPSRSRSRSPRTRRRLRSRSPRSPSRSDSADSVSRERVRPRSPSSSRSPPPPPPPQRRRRRFSSRSPARQGQRDDNGRARARDKVASPVVVRSPSPMRDVHVRRHGRLPSRSVSRSPSRSRSPAPAAARRGRYRSPSRSRSRSPRPRVQARLGRFEGRRYSSPSRSRTPPPPSRAERGSQQAPYLPTPTTGHFPRRSRSASTGSSMSVSSRSASRSRSD